MTAPLEDRLRAHFAERTEREPLPGPDPDDALARTLDVATRRRWRATSSNGRRNQLFLAVAAALLMVLGTVAFVVTRDDSDDVHTVDDPNRTTTTTTDTTTPEPTQPAGDASSTTSSSTTSTTAPAASGTTTSVVVGFDGVLGWWDGSTWVQADGAPIPVEGGEQYQVLQVGQPTQTRAGELSTRNCVENDEPTIDLGFDGTYPPFEPEPVAVTGVDDPQPRPVAAVATDNAEYRTSAVDVLAGLGIDDLEPEVVQAVRADLDGDGADEVLVTVERISDPQGLIGAEGDYSVTFMRRVAGGEVATTIVDETSVSPADVANSTPFVAPVRVATAADLNGDGQMEVVLGRHYYEGHNTTVYELQADGSLTQVIAGGCGL